MSILLENTPELGKIFEVQNSELDFRSEVPSETRKQICKFVADAMGREITFFD